MKKRFIIICLTIVAFTLILFINFPTNSLLKSLNKNDYDFCLKKGDFLTMSDGLYMFSAIQLEKFVPTEDEKEKTRKDLLDIYITDNGEVYYYYYGHPNDYLVSIKNGRVFEIIDRKYYFGGKFELEYLHALMPTTAIDFIDNDPNIILDQKTIYNIFNDEKYKNNLYMRNILDKIF
jgi:hypothetical protein